MTLAASPPRRRPHRGGRGFEPRAVVRAREARIVELSTEGRSQRSIAAEVGVSQVAVCRILQRADDRVLATLHRDRIRLLARIQRRTEHVYAEAHAGWRRSHADRQRRTQRMTSSAPGGAPERSTVAIVTESQAGDPRFLREMLRALTDARTTFRLDQLEWDTITQALLRAEATRRPHTCPHIEGLTGPERQDDPQEGA